MISYIDHPAYKLNSYLNYHASNLFNYLNIREPSSWIIESGNNGFSCHVTIIDDVQKILISEGVPKLIYNLLEIILSDNTLFPDIGKSNNIVQVQNLFLPDYKLYDLASPNIVEPELDEERSQLLGLIYMMVLDFLLAHEATHIADGHHLYINSDKKKKKPKIDLHLHGKVEYQCLEVFADTYATSFCLNEWLTYANYKYILVPDKLQSNDKIFDVFVFAIYFLTRVMTGTTPITQTYGEDHSRKHPINANRWGNIIKTLFYELMRMNVIGNDFMRFQLLYIHKQVGLFEESLKRVSITGNEGFQKEFERDQLYTALRYNTSLRAEYRYLSPDLDEFRTRDIYKEHFWYNNGMI